MCGTVMEVAVRSVIDVPFKGGQQGTGAVSLVVVLARNFAWHWATFFVFPTSYSSLFRTREG